MNDQMQAAMAEATRLTRAGRLAEATALIQRTLGGMSNPDGGSASADAPRKPGVRVVEEIPSSPEQTIQGGAGASSGPPTAHPPVSPQKSTPDVIQLPGSLHGSILRGQPLRSGDASSSADPGGKFIGGTFSNAAGTRTYKLYIPMSYTGQAVPLVIMLHGCTQNPVDFATGTRMNKFAEEKTFLVAYPEQVSSANNTKCWNWFRPADQQRDLGEPSIIVGITGQIMNSYHVDLSRVYVAGMSAGGAMAVIMAATYPDLYAAVGVHSGLAYRAAHDVRSGFMVMRRGAAQTTRPLARAIPLIAFHGDCDTTVSPANTDHLIDQWLQATGHGRGRSSHNTKVERGQAAGGRAYTRSTFNDAGGHTIVEKWLVHQAGHAWSGGSSNGSFTDPGGPDASSEMLRFFNEHSRKR